MNKILQEVIFEKVASKVKAGTKLKVNDPKSQHYKKTGNFLGYDELKKTVFLELDKETTIEVPYKTVGLDEMMVLSKRDSLPCSVDDGLSTKPILSIEELAEKRFPQFNFQIGGYNGLVSVTVWRGDNKVDWFKVEIPNDRPTIVVVRPEGDFEKYFDKFLDLVNEHNRV